MDFACTSTTVPEVDAEDYIEALIVTSREIEVSAVEEGTVHIGWDTEYQQVGDKNDIVSTQLWVREAALGLIILWKESAPKIDLKDIIRISERLAREAIGKRIKRLRFISHWSLAEFSTVRWRSDVSRFFSNMLSIGDSLVSQRANKVKIYDVFRNQKEIMVSFHDTALLSGGSSLEKLGQSMGLPKAELPYGAITKMRETYVADRDIFLRYAILDAIISAEWFCWFDDFRRELVPGSTLPLTAPHLAGQFLRDRCGETALTGKTVDDDGKLVDEVDQAALLSSYHGGRNECFQVGFIEDAVTYADLTSAYPTVMLPLMDPDWKARRSFTSMNEVPGPFLVGAAKIDYRFTKDCAYPCFAQSSDHGLVFTRSGAGVWVSIPELWAAHHSGMLDHLRIHSGRGFFFEPAESKLISKAFEELILKRRQESKGGAGEKLLKILANSGYGKLAQGVDEKKKVFDLQATLEYMETFGSTQGKGRLFSPGLAAYITGAVRACLFETLNYLEQSGLTPISATTDGILHRGHMPAVLSLGAGLPFSERIVDGCREVLGEDFVLWDTKHRAYGCVSMKMRFSWGCEAVPGSIHDPHIQRGGFQTRDDLDLKVSDEDARAQLMRRYTEGDYSFTKSSLSGLPQMFKRVDRADKKKVITDLVRTYSETTINGDYDLKRSIAPESICSAGLAGGVRFGTRPHETLADYLQTRKDYEAFGTRKLPKGVRKNYLLEEAAVREFLQYHLLRQLADGPLRNLDEQELVSLKVAKALLASGHPAREVVKVTGCGRSTVYKLADSELEVRPIPASTFPGLVAQVDVILGRVPSKSIVQRARAMLVQI